MHTQECAIQVHGILVHHSYSCTTRAPLCNLVHHYVLSCTTRTRAPILCTTPTREPLCTRAPLRNLVHYLCTAMYSRAPLILVQFRAPILLMHHSRAPLVLLHHSALVHRSVISWTTRAPLVLVHYSCTATCSRAPVSCTTHAPLCNLVHHSSTLVHYSRALPSCTTLMHH